MSKKDSPSSPDAESIFISRLQFLRAEERHEIEWISHRLGWLLTCEAFLLTAAVVAQSGDYQPWFGPAATLLLGSFGIFLAFRGLLAVESAHAVLTAWLLLERKLAEMSNDDYYDNYRYWYRIPRPFHLQRPLSEDVLHTAASSFHRQLPLAVIILWAAIFGLSVIYALARMGEDWSGVLGRRELAAILMTIIIGGVLTCRCIAAAFRAASNVRDAAIALHTHKKFSN
jgi:hypothetical protein